MMTGDIEQISDVPAGTLLIGGTFAIYTAGAGALVLVTEVDGRQERKVIPRAIVDIFQGKGPMAKVAAKMFGGMGG